MPMVATAEPNQYINMAKHFFGASHPLFSAFGINLDDVGKGVSTMSIPFNEDLCDRSGSIHRGVIVTLLDTNCGLAIFSRLGDMRPIATIDLRVDFIKQPEPGDAIYSEVECYAVQDAIAYVRGRALSRSGNELLATAAGSFAVGTRGPSFDSAVKPQEQE
jgi:uncharacterized protein (TIGR00369 family)